VASITDPDLLGSPQAGPAAVRGGVLRIVGYAVGVLITVGSAAVLFRHLGVDDAGRYVLVMALVTLFGGVTDAGLSTIGVRELSAVGGLDRGVMLRNLLGLRIAFTSLGVALACAYAVAAGWDRALIGGVLIAGVGLLAANVQNALSTVLIADLRFGWVTIADLVRQAVTAAAIVALAVAGAALLPFFAASALAGAAALVLTVALVRGVPARPAVALPVWRRLLRDTLPFALAAAVGAIYFRLAILLVELFTDATETGYFGASFRVIEVLVIVPQLAIGAAFPIFARAASHDPERLRYAVGRTFQASLLFGCIVALGIAVGAPFVIETLAGPDFAPAAAVLRWHAVALVASFVAALFGYALLSLRRHRAVLAMNAAALAAMAIAGAALIPSHGAAGAASATAISEAVLAGAGALALAGTGALGGIRLAVVPRLVVAVAAGVAAAWASGLPSLPAALLALLVCAALALVLRVVPHELLIELRAAAVRLRASRAAGRRR
jgi:O-antigen/teichoic acid export membrane protein